MSRLDGMEPVADSNSEVHGRLSNASIHTTDGVQTHSVIAFAVNRRPPGYRRYE